MSSSGLTSTSTRNLVASILFAFCKSLSDTSHPCSRRLICTHTTILGLLLTTTSSRYFDLRAFGTFPKTMQCSHQMRCGESQTIDFFYSFLVTLYREQLLIKWTPTCKAARRKEPERLALSGALIRSYCALFLKVILISHSGTHIKQSPHQPPQAHMSAAKARTSFFNSSMQVDSK